MDPVLARIHGPAHLRLLIQPLFAILLGIRDGLEDARQGRPPYLWHILTSPGRRRALWREGLASIAKPLFIAVAIDSLFQILVLGFWRPVGALLVGAALIALPYVMARGLANRIATRRRRAKSERPGRREAA